MEPDEYRKLAAVEDRMWYFRALHALVFQVAAERMDPRSAARVLDAGCGTGGLIARLHRRAPAWRWNGLDSSPLACELARGRTGLNIVEASITAMPYADGGFDAVLSVDVIYQLEEPAAALREMARCVRPGGWTILNAPAYRWLWSYHDEAVGGRRRFTRRELTAECEAAGLVVERSTYLFMFTFPLLWAKRKIFRRAGDRSDVHEYPAALDALFGVLAALERRMIGAGWRSPFGSSVFIVARRPAEKSAQGGPNADMNSAQANSG